MIKYKLLFAIRKKKETAAAAAAATGVGDAVPYIFNIYICGFRTGGYKIRPYLYFYLIILSNSPSLIIATPRLVAFSSLLPASSPATT